MNGCIRLIFVCAVAVAGCGVAPTQTRAQHQKPGAIDSPLIDESSGLAASRRYPGYYWTHNDNGRNPGLFLIDQQGTLHAQVQIDGARFRDWEAIDCRRVDEQNYLVVADVGDNSSRYPSCKLHLFVEPEVALPAEKDQPVQVRVRQKVTLEFVYPDGPNDCEAMAVDVESRSILLVGKRMDAKADATMIHSVPWQLESTVKPVTAVRTATSLPYSMVTGFDIGQNNELAAVRNYTSMWIYRRQQGQSWIDALSSDPTGRLLPIQRQGEAIGFASDGKSILITSEGIGQPLWQVPLEGSRPDRRP